MAEILPDGTLQGYSTTCPTCKSTVSCNMQGDIMDHKCSISIPIPKGLHPDSVDLIKALSERITDKMFANQSKYGWTNEWKTRDWEQECRDEMRRHIEKGDPRDVAIYCAFMIYRNWPTSVPLTEEEEAEIEKMVEETFRKEREEKAALKELVDERDALQRFKDFVHRRLDEMGIPSHPDGEHSKAGCRIGDRLDIVELNYTYQYKVGQWLLECFGSEISSDRTERAFRFTEEALELVQSLGLTKDQVLELVEYVYGRPEGVPHQEVGGVMVTLAALCFSGGLSMREAAIDEYKRILTKIDKIRAKHFSKPKGVLSPIPGNSNQ